MSSCGPKVREFIILTLRQTKPTLTQVKEAISSREYIQNLDIVERAGRKETTNAVKSTRRWRGDQETGHRAQLERGLQDGCTSDLLTLAASAAVRKATGRLIAPRSTTR
jgi:hypothetical protein